MRKLTAMFEAIRTSTMTVGSGMIIMTIPTMTISATTRSPRPDKARRPRLRVAITLKPPAVEEIAKGSARIERTPGGPQCVAREQIERGMIAALKLAQPLDHEQSAFRVAVDQEGMGQRAQQLDMTRS